MKKIFLSMLVLSLAVAVNAQHADKGRHGKMKGHKMEKLNLTDEQKAKIKAIREKSHADIQSVLTAEQKTQIQKMKAERKAGMEGKMKDRSGKMAAELGLTADQKTKMQNMRQEMGAQMKAIRENKSMDEAAKKAAAQKLKEEHKEKMKTVLTAEQIEKMKMMHKMHDGKRKRGNKAEKI